MLMVVLLLLLLWLLLLLLVFLLVLIKSLLVEVLAVDAVFQIILMQFTLRLLLLVPIAAVMDLERVLVRCQQTLVIAPPFDEGKATRFAGRVCQRKHDILCR
uniref:Uncharacterized protein n=1 Tax=Anopheles atroparvus TaxID=41427 RepID=A0A182IQD5_ANOAO